MFKRLQSWLHRNSPGEPGATEQAKSTRADAKRESETEEDQSVDSFRETIEQIVIAFILAFVFRTFAAEPFVIPTGSMAPTLFGRHKEYECEGCGYHNVIGASDELDDETGLVKSGGRIEQAICLNCGALNDVRDELAHTGDRILVTKYPYEMGSPERFDVFVFKFPEEPLTNFIKRLVGLPGETILIWGGDVYREQEDEFEILRKDPDTQRRIQIPVYDDRYPPKELLLAGWPERWAAVSHDGAAGLDGWRETDKGFEHDAEDRSFQLNTASPDWQWIRYRHYQSEYEDWNAMKGGARDEDLTVQARLIGDFCGYNAFVPFADGANSFERNPDEIDRGPFWVGDLTVSCEVDVESVETGASLLLELVEGVSRYRCEIDLTTGHARLNTINTQNDPEEVIPLAEGETGISGTGSHGLVFANVDSRLCLWVDGELVDFGEGAGYKSFAMSGNDMPTGADLTPVGIAARGSTVSISRLLLERDIYYRADLTHQAQEAADELAKYVERPHDWANTYNSNRSLIGHMTIEVGPHHYLALGDNSPRSKDSRVWQPELRTVASELLVGKAFWIYWPHGVPFMNDGRGYTIVNHYESTADGLREVEDYPKYTLPFYPNIWRMRLIR